MKRKENGIETEEEMAIIEAVERGEFVPVQGEEGEKLKESLAKAAKNTIERMTRRKAISIRLIEDDIERIKAIALQEGIPYQTLIGQIIHQYARGELKRVS
ncbi:hypothetical protein [Hydrogenimonas sp.]